VIPRLTAFWIFCLIGCHAVGADESAEPTPVIDREGRIFGIPRGTSGEKVVETFGPALGPKKIDQGRSALLYGKTYRLLFADGKLDAIHVGPSRLDWSSWVGHESNPPFPDEQWSMANGLRSGMSLPEVRAALKTDTSLDPLHRLRWPGSNGIFELQFSHFEERGNDDRAWLLNSVLFAPTPESLDAWNVHTTGTMAAGIRLAGIGVSATNKGIRVRHVYKGSPADLATIRPGDLIEKIDGQSTIGLSAEAFSTLLRQKDPHELLVAVKGRPPRSVALSKEDGSTLSGEMLQASVAAFVDVGIGEEAPDFEAVRESGESVRLRELRGKIVLIHFADPRSEACRNQLPALIEAHARWGPKLEIISVYLDTPEKNGSPPAREPGVTWPIRHDPPAWKGEVAQAYGISAVPTNILVDKDGKIHRLDFRVPEL
jgi:peroxiredoxin